MFAKITAGGNNAMSRDIILDPLEKSGQGDGSDEAGATVCSLSIIESFCLISSVI